MARRRINYTFLGIVLGVIVALAVAAVFGLRLLHRGNPQVYIANAHQFESQNQWDKAVDALGYAIALMPRDASLRVECGKDLMNQAGNDPSKRAAAASMWRTALEADPSNIEARHLLLAAYEGDLDRLEQMPKTDPVRDQLTSLFQAVSDMATQLSSLDPKDTNARTIIPALHIRLWLVNIPIPLTAAESAMPYDKRPTDDQKVTAAIATLTGLLHNDPTNVNAGLWIAKAKIRQAQLAQQKQAAQQALGDASAASSTSNSDELLTEAATIFDQPIAQRPNLASLYAAKAQVMGTLWTVESRPSVKAKDFAGLHDSLDHAQSLVDPKQDPNQWLAIKTRWAQVLSVEDHARAESVYRDVIAKMPNEVAPKVSLAQLISREPGRLKDALALLEQLPDQPPADLSPMRAALMVDALLDAKAVRTQILTDELRLTKDPTQRQSLTNEAQGLLDSMAPRLGDTWQFLKLKGSLQLAQGPGHYRDAAQTLDAAVSKMKLQTTGVDPELLLLQADAYQFAGQDGDASTVLEQAMVYPQVNQQVRPHLVLASLYLKQHNPERTRQQIDWLIAHVPDDPAVIKLQILALDPANNPANHDQAEQLLAKLPEKTAAEMGEKATIAQEKLNDSAQAERLYKATLVADPTNLTAALRLTMIYANSNRRDQAQAVLATAQKLHPGDQQLQIISDAVNGATPQAIAAAEAQMIRHDTSDPVTRELELADLSGRQNDIASQLLHLQNAQSYDANNPKVLSPLFHVYLALGKFDKAKPLIEPLGNVDADGAHGGLLRFQFDMASGDKAAALSEAQNLVGQYPQFASAWLALGDACVATGRYDDASANYLKAQEKQGTNPAALHGLIQCSYDANKLDDAKRYIDEAREQFPSDPSFRDLEIRHALQYGNPDSVVPTLLDQVKANPNDPQAYKLAAEALGRAASLAAEHADADTSRNRLSQAHDLLAQATAHWPDDLNFAAALAQTCVQQQDIAGAEAALKTVAARPAWQGQAAPQVALADMYVAAGRPADAEAPLRAAIPEVKNPIVVELKLANVLETEKKYDDALAVLQNDRAIPEVVNARAKLLLDMDRGPQAETEVLAALKSLSDGSTTAPSVQQQSLQNVLASVYFKENKLAETTALANSLLAVDPNDTSAHYYRAMANLKSHSPDGDAAIADLISVRNAQPNFIDARVALADAYSVKNDTDDAVRELEAAERAVPGNKLVRLRLVQLYSNATPPRFIEAQEVLSEALAMPLNKNDVDLLRALAVVEAQRGQSDAAVATIRQAMGQGGNHGELDKDYLHILLLNKNYPLLIQEADTLAANGAATPWWVYDFRARAKELNGDHDGAMKDFDLAMQQGTLQGGSSLASGIASDASDALGIDNAIALVEQRDSNDTRWKLIALVLYARKGDQAAAIKIAESAMQSMGQLSPQEQDQLLDEAGSVYLTANPPMGDKAAVVLQKVLQRHPDDIWAMNNLACVMAEDVNPPQPQEALQYSTKAYDAVVRSGRVQPLIFDTQGWVLILTGKVDQGIDILQKAADSGDFADLHYHLGQAYLRKKLPESAQHELQTASDMLDQAATAGKTNPGDAVLRQKVAAAMKQVQALSQDKMQATATP